MKALSLIAVILLVSCVSAQTLRGIVHLTGGTANPDLTGTVTFEQLTNGSVVMTVSATNVGNPGVLHGIHIHEFGDISMLNGTSVGSHFNPDNETHACEDTTDRHLGDTGNWDVDAGGVINQMKTLDLLTLTGGKSIIGHAVVLHNTTDNCVTVPSSGSRLGFGVIGIENTKYHNSTFTGNNTAVNGADAVPAASCVLRQIGTSNVTGFVYFEQSTVGGPTTIQAVVTGLDGNKHGFHIHEFGDLSDMSAGSSVGGHYNPLGANHSLPGFKQGHIGDLGNIYHYVDGVAFYKFTNSYVSLSGTNNVVGRAIVVHAMEDKCTLPSAGARLAFCVIGINGGYTTLSLPSTVPVAQDTTACDPNAGTTTTTGDSAASSFSQVQMIAMALIAIIFVAFF